MGLKRSKEVRAVVTLLNLLIILLCITNRAKALNDVKTFLHFRYQEKTTKLNKDGTKTKSSGYYSKVELRHKSGFKILLGFDERINIAPKAIKTRYNFISLGLYYKSKGGLLDYLAIGDYILNIGQHLVYGQAYGNYVWDISKHPFKKRDYGIKSYVYPGSLGSLQGIAFRVKLNGFKITPFLFLNMRKLPTSYFSKGHVNIKYKDLITTSSWRSNGKKKTHTHNEIGYGINGFYAGRWYKIGLLVSYVTLSEGLYAKKKEDNIDEYRGENLLNESIYFDIYLLNRLINIFGETALSAYKNILYNKYVIGHSTVFGSIIKSKSLSYTLQIRYISPEYQAPHGSEVLYKRRDELGFSNGINIYLFKSKQSSLELQFLADISKPASKLYNSVWHYMFDFRLEYKILESTYISYVFVNRYKDYYKSYSLRRKHQVNVVSKFYKGIEIRFRYENIYSKRDDEVLEHEGNLFYIQLSFMKERKYLLYGRVTFYKALDYDASLYIYERHLSRWYFPVQRFQGIGTKFDFILKGYVSSFEFGIRYSADKRTDRLYSALYINLQYRL